ncbi:MAG: DUF58 domain-containing protein, partial [Planctomycetota bacterium]
MSQSQSRRMPLAIPAAIAALLLAGMLFGASLWLLAAYAAFGLVLVNKMLAAIWARAPIAERWDAPEEVPRGAVVPIRIKLRNTSVLPIAWLLIEDLLPRDAIGGSQPGLKIEGDRLRVLLLGSRQSNMVAYNANCTRSGYYQIGPAVLETGDLMGLDRRYRVVAPPQFLLVLPRVIPLSGYDIASRRPIGEIRIRDTMMDDPTRLRGIRQWQPGDPMRSVHWSATARTGVLHSKIYEPTSVAGITLVLDLNVHTNPAQHEPIRSELAKTYCASVAAAMYEMNQPVGLVSNGRDAGERIRTEGYAGDFRSRDAARASAMGSDDERHRLRPVNLPAQRGPVQRQEIMRQLARLERSDGLQLP